MLKRWMILLMALIVLGVVGESTFSQDAAPEGNIPPQVLEIYPFPGTEMAGQTPLLMTFNQAMDQASPAAYIQLEPTLAGTFIWQDHRTVVFTPTDDWEPSTTYALTIAPEMRSENELEMEFPYQATLQGVGALTVGDVVPAPDSTDIDPYAEILVTFNRPVVPLVVSEQITTLESPLQFNPPVAGTGEWLNTAMYRFVPDVSLPAGTKIEVTVSEGLTSLDGAVLAESYQWNFTTRSPVILDIHPGHLEDENGNYSYYYRSDNIRLDTPITVSFSQPMDAATTETAFHLLYVAGNEPEPVAGEFSWNDDNTVLTFQPDSLLHLATLDEGSGRYYPNYRVEVAATALSLNGGEPLAEGREEVFITAKEPGVCYVEERGGNYGRISEGGEISPASYPIINFCSIMDVDTIEGRLHISPEPENWELLAFSRPTNYINIYTSLMANTTYTLTLDPGAADIYGNTIDEAWTLTFSTGDWVSYAYPITGNGYYYSRYKIINAYMEDTSIPMNVSGVSDVYFTLYGVNVDDFMTKKIQQLQRHDNVLRHWAETFDAGDRINTIMPAHLASSDVRQLPPGLYSIDIRYTGYSYRHTTKRENVDLLLAVATANITVKRSANEVLVWINDLESGNPVPDAPIQIFHEGELVAEGMSDSDGVLRLHVDLISDYLQDEWDESRIEVVAQADDLFGIWFEYLEPRIPGEQGYLYTDRPIYRPGETVYFRGIVRQRWDMDYTIPTNLSDGVMEVVVDAGSADQTMTVPVTEYGTFSGEFTLPEDTELVAGRIRASYGLPDTDERNYGDWISYEENYGWLGTQEARALGYQGNLSASVSFQVKDFRVPEFRVSTTAQTPEIIAGETIQVRVDANYYSGEPLNEGEVSWQASGCHTSFAYQGEGSYSFTDVFTKDRVYQNSRSGYYATLPRYYGYSYSGCILKLTNTKGDYAGDEDTYVRFSDEGTSTLSTDGLTLITSDFTVPADTRPVRLYVNADVDDGSGQVISNQTSVLVHPSTVYVGLQQSQYFVSVNDPISFDIITVTPESELIDGHIVEVEVMALDWQRNYAVDGSPYWQQIEETLETGQVVTGQDATTSYTYTPNTSGAYRIRVRTTDADGREHSSSRRFYVRGTTSQRGRWRPAGDTLDITPDKTEYEIGDTARFLIPLAAPGHVLITIERAGIIFHEVIETEDTTFLYELPLTEIHTPTLWFSAVVIYSPGNPHPYPSYSMGRVPVNVRATHQLLDIEITPSAQRSQPGEVVEFDIAVTDSEGEPVVAELGVKLTDRAILDLLPPNSLPLATVFYGTQWDYVNTTVSLSALLDRFLPFDERLDNTCECGGGGGPGSIQPAEPEIRDDFAQTPLWEPHVVTDANGQAQVSLALPDNLTAWELDVRAVTTSTQVGEATHEITSSLPLALRPSVPRFFVVGDRVQLATLVSNNTDNPETVEVTLQAEGVELQSEATQTITIPAGTRVRVNWWAVAQDVPGVDLTFSATSASGLSDAVKPMLTTGEDDTIPVYRYTAPDTVGTAGILRDGGTRTEGISLPPRLDVENSELVLNIQPSLSDTIIDSFDYLEYYPHLCIEQTVSRYLPNAITYRALTALGIDDPVLEARLKSVIESANRRLRAEQRRDGGWGWFYDMDSDPLVSAYATLGLLETVSFQTTQDKLMLENALDYLREQLVTPTRYRRLANWQLNRQAFYIYVLLQQDEIDPSLLVNLNALFEERLRLSKQSQAYLLMAYTAHFPDEEAVQTLISDLQSSAIASATGIHWEEDTNDWRNWTSDTRTTSLVLNALVRATPDSELLPNAVRWLMVARNGDHWESTQETVWATIALTDWMVSTGELEGAFAYSISLNDDRIQTEEVTPDTVRNNEELVIAARDLLLEELNLLVIGREEGDGILYYTAHLHSELPVADVAAQSRGVNIQRTFFAEDDMENPIDTATVGDVITVQVSYTLEEAMYYFVLESPIPAGTELLDTSLLTTSNFVRGETFQRDTRSWYWWGWWYIDRTELRDEGAYLYADYLPAGTYTYTYQVRAVTPGSFQTIPTHGYPFYFPEVFGRSDGTLFTIEEKE